MSRPMRLAIAAHRRGNVTRLWSSFGVAVLATTALPAVASDTCTIEYKLEGNFQVSDTSLGRGDRIVGVGGSLVVEYPQDRDGKVVDGKVKILHYAMHEDFTIESVVIVKTSVHHYTPTCNGVAEPSWRRPTDDGFPKECGYTGNRRAVATGTLSMDGGFIELGKCKPAPTYWAEARHDYRPSDKSKGKGCLDGMRAVGNVHCEGRLGCKLGGLERGDNPVFDQWNQPLVHGPPGSTNHLVVTADLASITSPLEGGYKVRSYNLPNDSPSRTWFSFAATRNEGSKFTTCR